MKEIGPGVSEKSFKRVDGRRTDRQTGSDHNSSSRAFSSGELKVKVFLGSSFRELTTKYFSIGDNSNLSHAATKTTHTKLFKPYLFIEPPQLNKFLRKNPHIVLLLFKLRSTMIVYLQIRSE